jgi:hypothetical protein
MDAEISVPKTPVALSPGQETRIPIEVCNRSAAALSLRLSVARSRAGAWSHTDPPIVELTPGDCAAVDVVFRPPANVLPTSTLQPFTVQAEDLRYGVPAGHATGLLTVAAADRLGAVLTPHPSGRGRRRYELRLSNRGEAPLTVRLDPELSPADGRVSVEPAVLDVPGGEHASAQVHVRPRARLIGPSTPYEVSVECRDVAAADDSRPLLSVAAGGSAGPRLARGTAAVVGVVALVTATGAAALVGRFVAQSGQNHQGQGPQATAPAQRPAVTVRRPYALVDVFPRQDARGRTAAEDALSRFTAAGMPVRLVDSTASDQVSDGQGGLWVLLQDGFSSAAEADAYCARYRAVAPKCDVVP